MRITTNRYQTNAQITPERLRKAIAVSIVLTLLLTALQLISISSPAFGVMAAFIMLAGLLIWTQWRLSKLQHTVKRLSHQVHRLSSYSQANNRIKPQAVSHVDHKQYFNNNQTKH